MGAAGASVEAFAEWTSCRWPSVQAGSAPGCGRAVVRGEDGLPVEAAAGELSSLAHGARAVPRVARRRHMGARRPGPARTSPGGQEPERHARRRDPRFAVRQDGAKRGRRGYDAGKKIKGRKRRIAVDTEGNLLACVVHSAGGPGPSRRRGRAEAALLPNRFHPDGLGRRRLYGQAC